MPTHATAQIKDSLNNLAIPLLNGSKKLDFAFRIAFPCFEKQWS